MMDNQMIFCYLCYHSFTFPLLHNLKVLFLCFNLGIFSVVLSNTLKDIQLKEYFYEGLILDFMGFNYN